MGLFDKAKKVAAPEPVTEPEIKYETEEETVWVNLTENMVSVELDGDDAYLKYAEVKENGDKIRIVSGGIILAEIGKRGKAHKELEPYIGKRADFVSLKPRTGEYGDYYSMKLVFKTNTATITF